MGTNSKIEWTDHTWNPWRGCTRISPGCDNCYMMREVTRFGHEPTILHLHSEHTFQAPVAFRHGRTCPEWVWPDGNMVFVCSWSDFFHPAADGWRGEAWETMARRPGLTFQILTKRPERMAHCLPAIWGEDGWPNVWLGVTAENQEMADRRIPILLSTPAAKRFVSVEPMLGPVDLRGNITRWKRPDGTGNWFSPVPGTMPERLLDWVICGGETGAGARFMEPEWARSLQEQCAAARVPFFMKQMTRKEPIPSDLLKKEFPK